MKVISWNVRRATAKSGVWDYLLEADPDVVLLQEVGGLSPSISERYHELSRFSVTAKGRPQKFKTTILTKLPVIEEVEVHTENSWVREQAAFFAGNIIAAKLQFQNQPPLHVINVYSPAWPIAREKWADFDASRLKLAANPDIWCTEILWDLLCHMMPLRPCQWIVGGDFNSSESFDFGPGGDRGNREIMDRLARLGFKEMLREHHGKLVPTFQNIRAKRIIHQLDHLYVTEPLSSRLVCCEVGDEHLTIRGGLSDHLPIIAEFASSDRRRT